MKKFEQFVNESSYVKDLSKLRIIIKSCKTEEQTEVAYNTFNAFKNRWKNEISDQDINEIDRLLQNKFEEVQ